MNGREKWKRSYLILNGMEFTRDEFVSLVENSTTTLVTARHGNKAAFDPLAKVGQSTYIHHSTSALAAARYWDEAVFDLLAGVGQPIYIYQELVRVVDNALHYPSDWDIIRTSREARWCYHNDRTFAIMQRRS